MVERRHNFKRRLIDPLARWIDRVGISPNALTIIGFLISLVAAFVIFQGRFIWAGAIVLLSGTFDMLDGSVARVGGKVTQFGAVLDSTLDRLGEAALLLGLLLFFLREAGTLEAVLLYATLVGSFTVSYIRSRAEGLGLKGEVGLFTRSERIIVLALGLFLNQIVVALWIMAALTYFTAFQRIYHVWKSAGRG